MNRENATRRAKCNLSGAATICPDAATHYLPAEVDAPAGGRVFACARQAQAAGGLILMQTFPIDCLACLPLILEGLSKRFSPTVLRTIIDQILYFIIENVTYSISKY